MIRPMIEALLGEFGRQILYFYEANQLIMNLIVLTYGLIMFLSWSTLIRIYRHLVLLIVKQIEENPDLGKKSKPAKISKSIEVPWETAVDAAKFPLIANNGGVIPSRKSVKAVQKLFDEEELISHALDVMQGTEIKKIIPSYRLMLKREFSKSEQVTINN